MILTVLYFITLSAHSQGTFGFYDVSDMLSGAKETEMWTATQVHSPPSRFFSRRVQIKTQKNIAIAITDTVNGQWSRKERILNTEVYYEEFLASLPFELEPTQGSYGYINVRNVVNDEILEAWPLFLKIESAGRGRKATFTAHLPNSQIMEVTRIFLDEGYFFPSEVITKLYKPGVIVSLVPENIEPSLFLEKYIIAKRKD
jgi:hypothetical protein